MKDSCAGNATCAELSASGFETYVGKVSLTSIEPKNYCKCNEKYGPNCNQSIMDFLKGTDCVNGVKDPGNTITGCSCRESMDGGNATEFHGWYCERSNR